MVLNFEDMTTRLSVAFRLCIYFCRAETELTNEAKSHILNHDNVVKLYAMVFEKGHYGVIVEYVPHGDLENFIFRNKVR